ncbi:MAG: hypothetical protein ACPGJV_04225 [Bacteriovoracaceae bacterium]
MFLKAFVFLLVFVFFVGPVSAQKKPKERIIYEYKKYEKFDFDDLVVEGDAGSPGDLSVDPRYQRKFKNKLPYRKNFHKEIRKGVFRIR